MKIPLGFGILDKGKDDELKTAISEEHLRNLTMKTKSEGGKPGSRKAFRFVYLLI